MGEPNQIREWQRIQEKPETHLNAAWQSLRNGMRGVGNHPDRELLSCVKSMTKALELGLPVDDLDLMDANRARWAGEPDELMNVWRLVATSLETEAIKRAQPTIDAMATAEAIDSMTPAQVPG